MASDPFFSQRPAGEGPRQPSLKISTRQLGTYVFFASLSMLFGASIVGYVLTRSSNDEWRPSGAPGLPLGLVASTILLVSLSVTAQYGLGCARHNRFESLLRALGLSFVLAAAFLVGQVFNWLEMLHGFPPGTESLYAFTFYLLTGLHAAHVLGGFVPLGIIMARAARKEYTSSRHEGVKLCVQYWHFLGLVWLVLLACLYWGSYA